MQKSKHTPGPWKPRVDDGQLFITATETILAPLWSGDGPGATCDTTKNVAIVCKYLIGNSREANAHLIAAAPELLEALKGVAEAQGWDSEEDVNTPYAKAAMRAIRKAEGQ